MQHFFGRFVGKGHRQDAARRHLPGLQQPGNAGGQHPGFSRARAGQNERVGGRQSDRSQLLWIKILQERRAGCKRIWRF